MVGLAVALAGQGYRVTFVAEREMSADRAKQGWQAPSLGQARILLAPAAADAIAIVRDAPADSIHICQGIRDNGVVGSAQAALARRGLQQWVVMETVDDAGLSGFIKRHIYRWLFWRRRKHIAGVLATGWYTSDWVVARGVNRERVFPFAYFLPEGPDTRLSKRVSPTCFRFIFVGQLIERKQLNLLIEALAMTQEMRFELLVIGDGPCKTQWQALAEHKLPNQVQWAGQLPMAEIPQHLSNADCLVLPSRHDGWGAVVSEALMVGTPAICSDACGSAGVVRASGIGGVFEAGDIRALTAQLRQMLDRGALTVDERSRLATWARALGASAGARYLSEILAYREGLGDRPQAPWLG
jgi:glycosyltransferase involved in cell wall biosynthesis